MDTKALKDKILQLAVQGKLVPQNDNDEPAIILLERIKKEKEQLIKDKKIKKEKPLPEITEDEIPYELPNGWEWVRLGNIINIKSSKRIYEKEYVEKGIPFFRSKEIGELSNGKDNIDIKYFISEERYNEIREKFGIPQKGDILLTSVGTIGNTWIVDERDFYYKDGNITQLEKNNNINNYYIEYFFKSYLFYDQLNKNLSGTAYNALTIIKLKKLIFPLPPLNEQKRIVKKIDSLFKLIDDLENNKQDLLQNISYVRNKALQLAVQGKLVPQDENDEPASVLLGRIKKEKEQLIKDKKIKKEKPLPEITEDEIPYKLPKGWEWTRIGEITTIRGGKRIPSGSKIQTNPTEHIYIRVTDMKNGTIKNNDLRYIDDKTYEKIKNYIITSEDIYITIAGTIAQVGIVPIQFNNMNLTENAARITPHIINKLWLKFFFESSLIKNSLLDKVNQVAQPKLALKRIIDTFIPLPPLNEQKRIVEKLDSIMKLCDELESELNN